MRTTKSLHALAIFAQHSLVFDLEILHDLASSDYGSWPTESDLKGSLRGTRRDLQKTADYREHQSPNLTMTLRCLNAEEGEYRGIYFCRQHVNRFTSS